MAANEEVTQGAKCMERSAENREYVVWCEKRRLRVTGYGFIKLVDEKL